jgi:predicted permease
MKLLKKLRALFQRGRLDAEMSEEMRLHLERRGEEYIARGMSPEDARYAALRKFGGVEQVKEIAREQRAWVWLEQIFLDVRFAVRGLRKSPGFTAVAVLTLALGIGVNTGVFSIINGLLLRARVADHPATYVHLSPEYSGPHEDPRMPGAISWNDYRAYKNGSRGLSDLAGWAIQRAKIDEDAQPQLMLLVTPNFFSIYGLERPKLGRLFRPDECAVPGAAPVIILSEEIWRKRFESDPQIVGRSVTLNRHPFTVIGVTPARFSGRLRGLGVWIPYTMQPALAGDRDNLFENADVPWLNVDGRLKPGVSRETALAELGVLAKAQDRLQPGRETTMFVTNGSLVEEPSLRAAVKWVPSLVLGAVSLVLLLTCINVTMLLLARAAARQREMAVRLALGAGRGRLLRMLLAESATLALGAGALSAYLAYQIPAIFEKLFKEAPNYPLAPDWQVFLYLAVATLLAAGMAGFSPAFKSARASITAALNGQENFFGAGRWRLRDLLVAAQVAMSVVLLVGAGIFVRAEWSMLNAEPGFETRQVLTVPLELDPARYRASAAGFYDTVAERVRSLAEVEAACYASRSPGWGTSVDAPGESIRLPGQPEEMARRVEVNSVSPDFFSTFRIGLVAGQAFPESRGATGSNGDAVMVSETFARTFWPGENTVGKVVEDAAGHRLQIIGVVRDTKSNFGVTEGPRLYRLWNPAAVGYSLMIRFRGAADPLAVTLKSLVKELDSDLKVAPHTVRSQMDEVAARFAAIMRLVLALGVVALLLSVVGIYGVVSFVVNRRTREMGIRLALGATRGRILWLVMRSALRPVLVGVGAGMAAALLAAQMMAQVLNHLPVPLRSGDPAVFLAVTILMVLTAALAVFRPALRAGRVDPMVALRAE